MSIFLLKTILKSFTYHNNGLLVNLWDGLTISLSVGHLVDLPTNSCCDEWVNQKWNSLLKAIHLQIILILMQIPFSHLLSLYLSICYVILLTFEGKKPHMRQWLVTQSSDSFLAEVFQVFLSHEINGKRSVTSFTSLVFLLANRGDWCDTRGKWPLARNLDRTGGSSTLA